NLGGTLGWKKYNNYLGILGGSGGGGAITLWDSTQFISTRILANGDSYFMGGNVGIGTDDPQQYGNAGITLDVNGGIRASYGIGVIRSDNWSGYNMSGDGGANNWKFGIYGDSYKSHIRYNNTDIITFQHNGRIAIGTTTPDPDAMLTLNYHLGAELVWQRNGTEMGRLCKNSGGGLILLTNNLWDPTVYIAADGPSWFRGGNVGIGNVGPNHKLHVDGDIVATGFLKANNYYSGDGSKGKTADVSGLTFKNGLYISGSIIFPPGGGDGYGNPGTHTDMKLTDIKGNYTRGLEDILQLNPVHFSYKENKARNHDANIEHVGLIAQDVQSVFPEAVSVGQDGYLNIDMHPVNIALINSIKELKEAIDDLQKENEQLKKQVKQVLKK
ncbi:MAG: tail fiber domain-containing protein, partial [Bacteroidales bacterium]|nr:tail fiber domain-containing protein [Bacteroidales bacterium]